VGRVGNASWEFEQGAEIAPGRSVLKPIGGGNMYEVHLVWDEHMHALLVAKVIRPDQVEDERALEDLRDEAEVLGRLSHPMIIRAFDVVAEGPHPHLLIEHLEGPPLRRLIRRHGPVPLQQLLPLALHLAGVLHYLSEEGYVHLDVKPDNTIMGVPPRLVDLSIARTFERAARVRKPIGTDAYMAPEQCAPQEHEGQIGSPADVWGLGATLFHAAAGERPFPREEGDRESGDPTKRFPQLVHHPIDLPPHLPDRLLELIERMLDRDPAGRPKASEVADRLEPLVAELPRKLSLSRRHRSVV
jgi:eukaryotic-like serine/threonine-protein kinase